MIDMFLNFLEESSSITLLVIGLLGFYFIAINWIFIYKLFSLNTWHLNEEKALKSGLQTQEVSQYSYLHRFLKLKPVFDEKVLELAKNASKKDSTRGLSFLSIVASTSPFIGLFGTVVSILETFKNLGDSELGAIAVIAQGVSEALIATAVGIFVATFAYTYHAILKRKAYEIFELLNMQSNIAVMQKNIGNRTASSSTTSNQAPHQQTQNTNTTTHNQAVHNPENTHLHNFQQANNHHSINMSNNNLNNNEQPHIKEEGF